MRRAYKSRLRPTKGQHLRLQASLDDHPEMYNPGSAVRAEASVRVVASGTLTVSGCGAGTGGPDGLLGGP